MGSHVDGCDRCNKNRVYGVPPHYLQKSPDLKYYKDTENTDRERKMEADILLERRTIRRPRPNTPAKARPVAAIKFLLQAPSHG